MRLVAPTRRPTAVDDGLGFERLLTSLSTRSAPLDLERLASALDYALEQVCLAMNADSRTIRRLADEKLRHALAEGERLRDQLENENDHLRREVTTLQGASLLVGASTALRHAFDAASQVAPTGATVLLVGETGTGKELFASQIHDLSPRRNRPMVRVNCSAIPSALIESELFGREKGAYTGALSSQAGRFEVADKSTLFLDEIGDLPLEMQIKLLRVLQERQIERLGSSKPINVDVRIVAATNRDLEKGIAQGTFRQDLYYRLNVFPIRVPPLRERPDDIPMLVWSFVDEFSKAFAKPIESVSKDSMLAHCSAIRGRGTSANCATSSNGR